MATINDVITRVKLILHDGALVRWGIDELVLWANDAQREIVVHRPEAYIKTEEVTLQTGPIQYVPTGGTRLIDVIYNTAGTAVSLVEKGFLTTVDASWAVATAVAEGIIHYMYDQTDPRKYFVYPNATDSTAVWISYTAIPAIIAVDDAIVLDESYVSCMVDYVLFRAFSKDAESAGNATRSVNHLNAFNSHLNIASQNDVKTNPYVIESQKKALSE